MTYPLIGNHGRLVGRRPVRAALAARPRRGPRDGRGAGPGAPDRPPAARRGRARDRGPGHPRARPSPARDRLPAGHHHGARRDGRRRRHRPGARRCRAGRTRTSWARSRSRRPTRRATGGRSWRSSTTASRRTSSRSLRRRGARVRVLPHTATAGGRPAGRMSRASCSRPGPGDPARLDGPVALARGDHRGRTTAAGHLPRPPDRGAGRRRRHAAPALRASRRQSPGRRTWAPAGSRSRPRTTRSRWSATRCPRLGLQRQPAQPQRRLASRGCATTTLPIETVQYHPEGSPGPLDAVEVFDRFLERIRVAG